MSGLGWVILPGVVAAVVLAIRNAAGRDRGPATPSTVVVAVDQVRSPEKVDPGGSDAAFGSTRRPTAQTPSQARVDEAFRTCICDNFGPAIDADEVVRRYGDDTLTEVRRVMFDVLDHEVDWLTHDLIAGGYVVADWLRETRPWLSERSIHFLISYFTWTWR